jgi:cation transport ATPase
MQFAAALESKSAHPLANAVVSAYCGCIAEFKGTLPEVNKIQVHLLLTTTLQAKF